MRVRFAMIVAMGLMPAGNAGAQTSQPVATAPNPSTPKGALKALAVALDAGDQAGIRNLMNVTSPMEQKMVEGTSEMAVAIADLKHAMAAKFGTEAAQSAMGDSPDVLQKSLATIDGATEHIDGDSAIVSISAAAPAESMSLAKVGGQWKISVAQQVKEKGLTTAQVDEKMAMVTAESKMLKDMTSEVTAGKYASANETAAALRAKMSGAREPATSNTTSTQPAVH